MEPISKTLAELCIRNMAEKVEEIREQEGEAWDSTKTMQLYAGLYGIVEEFLENRGMIQPVTHGQGEPSADPGDDHAGSNSNGYKRKPAGADLIGSGTGADIID